MPYKQGVSSSSLLAPTGISPNGTAIAAISGMLLSEPAVGEHSLAQICC